MWRHYSDHQTQFQHISPYIRYEFPNESHYSHMMLTEMYPGVGVALKITFSLHIFKR